MLGKVLSNLQTIASLGIIAVVSTSITFRYGKRRNEGGIPAAE